MTTHRMRTMMYLMFIGMSALPCLLILFLFSNLSLSLIASGAAELAFAFYAFTSGNTAYSIVVALPIYKRKEVLNKAKEIIRGGRYITFGAIILIGTGIFAPSQITGSGFSLYLSQASFLLPNLVASGLVIEGAYKLSQNMSFVQNIYLESAT